MENLEEVIRHYALNSVWIASLILLILAGISLKIKKLSASLKKILFFSIVATIAIPTLFMVVSTIYLNTISSSKGPVHWHADIEVWSCGKELDFVDPTGLSNKIGTPTLHEHNDKRIHLEGVVLKESDASLGKFFKVIGGGITSTSLTVPTTNGIVNNQSGQLCDNGESGMVQVFVYKTVDGKYTQMKVREPDKYIISPESAVPDGDCIIVEFASEKLSTDKLCRSYKVAEKIGKLQRGN